MIAKHVDALAASIALQGMLVPIVVCPATGEAAAATKATVSPFLRSKQSCDEAKINPDWAPALAPSAMVAILNP